MLLERHLERHGGAASSCYFFYGIDGRFSDDKGFCLGLLGSLRYGCSSESRRVSRGRAWKAGWHFHLHLSEEDQ